jgi:hypothetical protein
MVTIVVFLKLWCGLKVYVEYDNSIIYYILCVYYIG